MAERDPARGVGPRAGLPDRPRIVVVGAGAVGGFYGAMLARAGHDVTLVARAAQVQAIARDGVRLAMAGRTEAVRLAATTSMDAVRGADLVLVCVKSNDTDATACALAPWLQAGAIVMSLQNGVENADVIARHVAQAVVPVAVYVATAMPAPGTVVHHGRGDLVIGLHTGAGAPAGRPQADLPALAALFATAGVAVRISPDVRAELWSKLMVNCAYNAGSGLAQATYAQMADLAAVRQMQEAVVGEVVALAAAEGVSLPLDAALQAMRQIAVAMPGQRSSTAQDMARGRPSEIDHLNGFVARRGRERGVPTPVNQALHALVKLAEAARAAAGPHDAA